MSRRCRTSWAEVASAVVIVAAFFGSVGLALADGPYRPGPGSAVSPRNGDAGPTEAPAPAEPFAGPPSAAPPSAADSLMPRKSSPPRRSSKPRTPAAGAAPAPAPAPAPVAAPPPAPPDNPAGPGKAVAPVAPATVDLATLRVEPLGSFRTPAGHTVEAVVLPGWMVLAGRGRDMFEGRPGQGGRMIALVDRSRGIITNVYGSGVTAVPTRRISYVTARILGVRFAGGRMLVLTWSSGRQFDHPREELLGGTYRLLDVDMAGAAIRASLEVAGTPPSPPPEALDDKLLRLDGDVLIVMESRWRLADGKPLEALPAKPPADPKAAPGDAAKPHPFGLRVVATAKDWQGQPLHVIEMPGLTVTDAEPPPDAFRRDPGADRPVSVKRTLAVLDPQAGALRTLWTEGVFARDAVRPAANPGPGNIPAGRVAPANAPPAPPPTVEVRRILATLVNGDRLLVLTWVSDPLPAPAEGRSVDEPATGGKYRLLEFVLQGGGKLSDVEVPAPPARCPPPSWDAGPLSIKDGTVRCYGGLWKSQRFHPLEAQSP